MMPPTTTGGRHHNVGLHLFRCNLKKPSLPQGQRRHWTCPKGGNQALAQRRHVRLQC
jgi:hypothetical protein